MESLGPGPGPGGGPGLMDSLGPGPGPGGGPGLMDSLGPGPGPGGGPGLMDSLGPGLEDEDDEDVDTQYVIEQSLLDRDTKTETLGDAGRASEDEDDIFTAIRRGDVRLLETLCVPHGDGVSSGRDARGWTPLHAAAAQPSRAVLELVLGGAGPGALQGRTPTGHTPLLLALQGGLEENASFLLQHGADPHDQDHHHDSALLLAIRADLRDLVKLLLLRGCRVNQRGVHGRRPLHEASGLGRGPLVALLLEAGARPDPRSHYGLTPLALAAQNGHLEVVELLLSRGASVLSQAQDEASVLYEASACGVPDVVRVLLEHGADANVPKHTGHLPVHRSAHRGQLQVLELLIPATSKSVISDSGISPLHSAAAGGHAHCIKALLSAGFDPNDMLQPWAQRSYEDERKSALFFSVLNDDVPSARLLLEGGAMANQDPIKCLQIALRVGNYELINLLLRFGANVNYYCRVNTTHFPSALQYALKDQVMLRMLCNYGYDVERCFDCHYGDGSHVPEDFEGWTDTVIKDTMFCEVVTVYWLRGLSGQLVRTLLDYVDHVTLCSKLKAALMETSQWRDICRLQENARCLQHLCRLRIRRCLGRLRLRSPVFMSFLPLPRRLKDFLLYREYDLYTPPL